MAMDEPHRFVKINLDRTYLQHLKISIPRVTNKTRLLYHTSHALESVV